MISFACLISFVLVFALLITEFQFPFHIFTKSLSFSILKKLLLPFARINWARWSRRRLHTSECIPGGVCTRLTRWGHYVSYHRLPPYQFQNWEQITNHLIKHIKSWLYHHWIQASARSSLSLNGVCFICSVLIGRGGIVASLFTPLCKIK